jgi:superfamily II DNA or RNA helicase
MYGDLEKDIGKHEFIGTNEPEGYIKPHQTFLRNWISKNTIYDNLLVYHGLGTGKTCVAISIAEGFKEYLSQYDRKVIILVKNDVIQENFINELKSKCADYNYNSDKDKDFKRQIKQHYSFHHHQDFVQNYKEDLSNTVIIIDEFHNMIGDNEDDMSSKLTKLLKNSYNYRLVLMSATPITDNVYQIIKISNLLNVSDPDLQIPVPTNNTMDVSSLNEDQIEKLKKALKGKVSYVAPNIKYFPKKIQKGKTIKNTSTKVIKCEMSDYQYKQYTLVDTSNDFMYNKKSSKSTIALPENNKGKDFMYNTNKGKENIKDNDGDYEDNVDENVFKIENLHKYSSKLTMMYNILNHQVLVNQKCLIYSSLVKENGLNLVQSMLKANGYIEFPRSRENKTFAIITGETTNEDRKKILKIFNSIDNARGKNIRVLLGSKAISEGITLKCVTQVHILEPDWNVTSLNQVIGRAVRNNSHADLPLEERKVEIYRYVATSENFTGTELSEGDLGIDTYKYMISELKDKENKKMERILKEIAIDCNFNNTFNQEYLSSHKDGSPECDYTACTLNCTYKPSINGIEKLEWISNPFDHEYSATYALDIPFFSNVTFRLIKSKIIELFREHFIWDYDTILNKFNNYNKIVLDSVLDELESTQEIFTNNFDTPGYLIYREPYYIFNPKDSLEKSSVFSKFIAKKTYIQSVLLPGTLYEPQTASSSNNQCTEVILSAEDKIYNKNIREHKQIYGNPRCKVVKGGEKGQEKYGELLPDNLFYLTTPINKDSSDKRVFKTSGTFIKSVQSPVLEETAKSLGITIDEGKDYSRNVLIQQIRQKLIDTKAMLR